MPIASRIVAAFGRRCKWKKLLLKQLNSMFFRLDILLSLFCCLKFDLILICVVPLLDMVIILQVAF